MFRFVPTLILAAAGSTSLGALALQEGRPQDKPVPGKQETPGSTSQGRGARVEGEKNVVLATMVVVHNKKELEISRLAEQRATDPEVKQFAQKMVADHGQLEQKLQAFASSAAVGGRPAEAGAGKPTGIGTMDFDHIALVQELGQQTLQTAKSELEKKQGADFDRCYMGMMLMGHLHANDMLTVFGRHAEGELKTAFQDAQRGIQQHTEEARRITEKLEK